MGARDSHTISSLNTFYCQKITAMELGHKTLYLHCLVLVQLRKPSHLTEKLLNETYTINCFNFLEHSSLLFNVC